MNAIARCGSSFLVYHYIQCGNNTVFIIIINKIHLVKFNQKFISFTSLYARNIYVRIHFHWRNGKTKRKYKRIGTRKKIIKKMWIAFWLRCECEFLCVVQWNQLLINTIITRHHYTTIETSILPKKQRPSQFGIWLKTQTKQTENSKKLSNTWVEMHRMFRSNFFKKKINRQFDDKIIMTHKWANAERSPIHQFLLVFYANNVYFDGKQQFTLGQTVLVHQFSLKQNLRFLCSYEMSIVITIRFHS